MTPERDRRDVSPLVGGTVVSGICRAEYLGEELIFLSTTELKMLSITITIAQSCPNAHEVSVNVNDSRTQDMPQYSAQRAATNGRAFHPKSASSIRSDHNNSSRSRRSLISGKHHATDSHDRMVADSIHRSDVSEADHKALSREADRNKQFNLLTLRNIATTPSPVESWLAQGQRSDTSIDTAFRRCDELFGLTRETPLKIEHAGVGLASGHSQDVRHVGSWSHHNGYVVPQRPEHKHAHWQYFDIHEADFAPARRPPKP